MKTWNGQNREREEDYRIERRKTQWSAVKSALADKAYNYLIKEFVGSFL